MTRSEALTGYLLALVGRPFAWGRDDCMTLPADWVRDVTGRDPAAAWRGRVETARDALRELKEEGGLEAVAARGCEAAGLRAVPAFAALPGDVGLVSLPCGRAAGAIRVGEGWAVRTRDGFATRDLLALKAWRVE